MAITTSDVFSKALALCDYFEEDLKQSPLYNLLKNKVPVLCDIAQRDLIYGLGIYNRYKYDLSKLTPEGETEQGFYYYKLPRDCYLPLKIIEGSVGRCSFSGVSYLFVPNEQTGVITIIYKAVPAPINTMYCKFSLDDNTVLSTVPYYIAANFIAEENPAKSGLYLGLYEKAKQQIESRTLLSEIENIEQSY